MDVVFDVFPGESAEGGVVGDLSEAGGGGVADPLGLAGDEVEEFSGGVVMHHLGGVARDGIDRIQDEAGFLLLGQGEGFLLAVLSAEAVLDLLQAAACLVGKG